jgi:hypothetical protein
VNAFKELPGVSFVVVDGGTPLSFSFSFSNPLSTSPFLSFSAPNFKLLTTKLAASRMKPGFIKCLPYVRIFTQANI